MRCIFSSQSVKSSIVRLIHPVRGLEVEHSGSGVIVDVHDYLDVLVSVDMFERNRGSVFPYVVQAADCLVEILLSRVAVVVFEVQFAISLRNN